MPIIQSRAIRMIVPVAAMLAVTTVSAQAATPSTGKWIGKVVKGQAMKGSAGQPKFTVSGHKLKNFRIGGVGADCFAGYSVVSVSVPSAAIHGGKFSTTIHPITGATVKLTGWFRSPTKVRGTVTGSGYACDYTIGFVAHHV